MQNITSKEQDLLLIIAEYQPLSIEQISLITNLGKREIQRKINNLYKKHYINYKSRKPDGKKGRSENIIFQSEIGFKYLQEKNIINDKISLEKFITTRYINTEHQLLLTWFRIHLEHIPKKMKT